jgi:hypothetical protein
VKNPNVEKSLIERTMHYNKEGRKKGLMITFPAIKRNVN